MEVYSYNELTELTKQNRKTYIDELWDLDNEDTYFFTRVYNICDLYPYLRKHLGDLKNADQEYFDYIREGGYLKEIKSSKTTTTVEAAPLIPVFITQDAEAAKVSQQEVKYTKAYPMKGRQCFDCKYFISKDEKCMLVAGEISPGGHCKLWKSGQKKEKT